MLGNVKIVPVEQIQSSVNKEIMRNIDLKRCSNISLCIINTNDGLWTEDKHLKNKASKSLQHTRND